PEQPDVADESFRLVAEDLVSHWQTRRHAEQKSIYMLRRLEGLHLRLNTRLAECKKIAVLNEPTPQLELLESTRMLQSVLEEAEREEKPFRKLAVVETPEGDKVPRVMRVTEE